MSTPLPPGWVELHDITSNSVYYYNEITFSSSWEHPSPGLVEFDLNAVARGESPTFSVTSQKSNPKINANTTPNSQAGGYTPMVLHNEWEEYIDPESNLPYYMHILTY